MDARNEQLLQALPSSAPSFTLASSRAGATTMTSTRRFRDEGAQRPRTTRRVSLGFDEFGWESLEAQAARDGQKLDEWLALAAAYFDAELGESRAAAFAPRFKPEGQGTSREISLELTDACWKRLESEAEERGVTLDRLLEHAALFFLADVDSGRVADHVLARAKRGRGEGQVRGPSPEQSPGRSKPP
jgi:hypothetical protein